MSALDTPPPDSEQWLPRADACGLKLARLYSHMLRCNVQAYALKRLERQVEEDPHHVHIVVDFKMKFLAMRFREVQSDHFGKRGMAWHGAAIVVNRRARNAMFAGVPQDAGTATLHPFQVYYMHDILIGTDQQNTAVGLAMVDSIITRVKEMFPDTATVSLQSDNGPSYVGATLAFMLPYVCEAVGVRITQFVRNEAGDGKTFLDAAFGVMSEKCREYVHRGNDILTPDQLITALKDKPPINTMVAGVVVNAERLKRLEAVELKEKVVGLALARCVMYPPAPEDFNAYVEVRRYGVVSEAPSSRRLSREVLEAAIPAELRTKPAGFWCLSGCVLKHAMLEPTKLALSRSWEPKYKTEVVEETRDGAPDGDAGDDQLDVVVTDEVIIIPKVGTFYRCRTCCELVSAWGLRRHQCKGEPSSVISGMSALNQAKRLVLTDKPTDAPPTRLRLLDADMVVCPPLPRGFARRPKKDSSRFDPAVRAFIKRLFDEGNAPGAMKKWNEVEALDLLRTSTNPKFTAAQLEKPTAQNIKSLFARFSSELKEARKPILQAAVSNTREPVVPPLPAPAPSQAAMPQAPPAAPIVSVRADGVGNKRHVQPVAPEAPAAVLLASPPLPKRPRPAQPAPPPHVLPDVEQEHPAASTSKGRPTMPPVRYLV